VSFARRFPAQATEIAPAHSPFQVGRVDERPGELAGLFLLDALGENKSELLGYESTLVARTIRHALDNARKIPRSQRERDESEHAQPGDFLIVTRNTTNLSRYASELQALGVPHQVTGGTSLNESQELGLLCTCLRALARPDDPVALVATLRSELFGISDAALYAFKRAGGKFSFRETVPHKGPSLDDQKAIRDAFERLKCYYGWLYLMPPAASIEKIAGHLGLFARAVAASGGDIRAGSLAKVVELIRAAEPELFSVMGVVDYLEGLVRSNQKHDAISVRPHSTPVVRLMNLHKVKGLEAPIVFLSDPTGQFEHPIDLHVDRSGPSARGYMAVFEPRSSVGYAAPRVLAQPSGWSRLKDKEREFQQAENERLLYVAATRAGTCLIVARREKRPKENPWHSLTEDLADREVHQDPGPQVRPARPEISITAQEIEDAETNIANRWDTLRRRSYTTEAIKQAALSGTESKSALDDLLSPALAASADSKPAGDTYAGEHGVEWGEDIHILLETAMRKPDASLEHLARSLTRDRDGERDGKSEGDDERVSALLDCVRAVQQSAIWKRARASKRVFAEIPLMALAAANEAEDGPMTIRRGVIDLAFWENEGWVIVDYKTDRAEPRLIPKFVKYYGPQVESYADTWQTLTGEAVHEVGLFFTRANRYERVRGT
jgi:ATP-dependent helicase/nuclease subunit A